jgi:hypothetical protein
MRRRRTLRLNEVSIEHRRIGLLAEPMKEEVPGRIAELEKQVGMKKSGKLEFRVSEKGNISMYGLDTINPIRPVIPPS